MACEFRLLGVHVHGHEADIEAFFDAFDKELEKLADTAAILWPSLEIMDADLDLEDDE